MCRSLNVGHGGAPANAGACERLLPASVTGAQPSARGGHLLPGPPRQVGPGGDCRRRAPSAQGRARLRPGRPDHRHQPEVLQAVLATPAGP